jgi:hypothetical protein
MVDHLQETLRRSPGIAVISPAMSREFARRYGVESTPLMNCVDALGSSKEMPAPSRGARFAYVGGLHLGRAELLAQVARAVEDTPGAQLSVHAPADDLRRSRELFEGFTSTTYGPSLPADEVAGTLANADALVHLESFDEATAQYTRLSISTKIPQYLAAARPILAVGPGTLASVQHLQDSGAALVVNEQGGPALRDAIQRLTTDEGLRWELSEAGVAFAARHHLGQSVRARLRELLERAAEG